MNADAPHSEVAAFDVLLPYFGDVQLMKEAVASVLAQTGDDWRMIVVDDGYPDPSVARWFAELADPRVRYVRNDVNLGANANYQKALGMATADHVVVMGADDIMLPNYLDRMRVLTSRFPDAAVIQPGVRVIDGSGAGVFPLVDRMKAWARPSGPHPRHLAGESLARTLLRGNWTYFPSLCWRRSTVQSIGFRSGLDVVQDLALLVDVALAGGALILDPEVTFAYRRHADSDSAVRARAGGRFREEAAFFADTAEVCRAAGWSRAARAARLHLFSRLHAAALLVGAARTADLRASARLLHHTLAW